MKFPWQTKTEHRAGVDFTGAVIDAALSAARGQGSAGEAAQVASVVFGVGLLSRGFSTAKVMPSIPALDPETLSQIARSLLLTGNSIQAIDVDPRDGLRLIPTVFWDIVGDVRPSTWLYSVDMASPSGRTTTRTVRADGIVHCRINPSLVQPWRGRSPLGEAGLSADLLGNLERRLAEEALGRTGYLLPIPEGLSEAAQTQLRTDLSTLKGGIKIVETTSGGMGAGRANAPLNDWKPQRLGADFPAANVELRKQASADVLAALGVPSGLLGGEGGAAREAWRHTVVTALIPMAKLVSAELSTKLEQDIEITFPSLVQTDIAARARAYSSLVGAGMDAAKAEMLAGLASA